VEAFDVSSCMEKVLFSEQRITEFDGGQKAWL
jgi:hypothetical protein